MTGEGSLTFPSGLVYLGTSCKFNHNRRLPQQQKGRHRRVAAPRQGQVHLQMEKQQAERQLHADPIKRRKNIVSVLKLKASASQLMITDHNIRLSLNI